MFTDKLVRKADPNKPDTPLRRFLMGFGFGAMIALFIYAIGKYTVRAIRGEKGWSNPIVSATPTPKPRNLPEKRPGHEQPVDPDVK